MWYPARFVSEVPLVFSVGSVQERVAVPVAGLAGGAGGAGAEGGGAAVGAAVAEAEAGDTLTPSPQAVRSDPAISRAESENRAFMGPIVDIEELKYGCLVHAICRRLRT
jgi:hypothetical protein